MKLMPRGGARRGPKKKLSDLSERDQEAMLVSMSFGTPPAELAKTYGVTPETFIRFFGAERIAAHKRGMVEQLKRSALYQALHCNNTTMQIFLMKTMGRMAEYRGESEGSDEVVVHGGLPEAPKEVT